MEEGKGSSAISIKEVARIGFGWLLAVVFGLVLVMHGIALVTGGLTATDVWELPPTLSISIGLGLCGCGLLSRQAKTAWAAPGCGLGIAGLYLVVLCGIGLLRGGWCPLTGSAIVNLIAGIVLLVLGLVLLWMAFRVPSPAAADEVPAIAE